MRKCLEQFEKHQAKLKETDVSVSETFIFCSQTFSTFPWIPSETVSDLQLMHKISQVQKTVGISEGKKFSWWCYKNIRKWFYQWLVSMASSNNLSWIILSEAFEGSTEEAARSTGLYSIDTDRFVNLPAERQVSLIPWLNYIRGKKPTTLIFQIPIAKQFFKYGWQAEDRMLHQQIEHWVLYGGPGWLSISLHHTVLAIKSLVLIPS